MGVSKSIIKMNTTELERALTKATKKSAIRIRELLIAKTKENINSLQFKDNPVVLANGGVTSDLDRKNALLNSFDYDGHFKVHLDSVANMVTSGTVTGFLSVMAKDFENSHIGWYYEVGTGEEADPKGYAEYNLPTSLGDPNPYRVPGIGMPIVSRYRGDGTWRDFGGNLRSTKSPIGGVGSDKVPKDSKGKDIPPESYAQMVKSFREYIGPDIQAYYWFSRAVEDTRDEMVKICIEEIKKINFIGKGSKILQMAKKVKVSSKGFEVIERH